MITPPPSQAATGCLPMPGNAPIPATNAHAQLVSALTDADRATARALPWFRRIARGRLYEPLGHPSLESYARDRLGFSDNRLAQFKQLCLAMDALPPLAMAIDSGRLGWTKAQLVARVATPATIDRWLDRAMRTSRRQLASDVRETQRQAARRRQRRRDRQLELPEARSRREAADDGAESPQAVDVAEPRGAGCTRGDDPNGPLRDDRGGAPADPESPAHHAPSARAPHDPVDDPPTTLTHRLDGLQRARYEALIERLRKQGHRELRADLLLAALTALVEADEDQASAACHSTDASRPDESAANAGSTGPIGRGPSARIIVHRCPDCARARVVTDKGAHPVAPADLEALACDAEVVDGTTGRRRHTIAPTVRQRVLARDAHRCRAPGCRSTRHLEIHHITPVAVGGSSRPENLITLCSRCHQHLHRHAAACAGTSVQDLVNQWLEKSDREPHDRFAAFPRNESGSMTTP